MSRARDLASSGVTSTVLSEKAPLASPDFTGTVDLTGTTISLDNDQISGDKVSGGEIGAGTFNGTVGPSSTFNDGINSANINQFTAKAWVYWTGYQTPVPQNSFNATLSSSGGGVFYITFNNNMGNVNYVVIAQGQVAANYPQTANVSASSKSVSRTGNIVFNENGSNDDPYTGQIVVFGD